MAKELTFKTNEGGCIIPTSHKLNADGYFRKHMVIEGKAQMIMYHRYVWEVANGAIPKGYEVDHMCKTRACCNVDHLQILTHSAHRTKDNTGRYSHLERKAKELWLDSGKTITGTALGELVGVSFSATCKWIRAWKVE